MKRYRMLFILILLVYAIKVENAFAYKSGHTSGVILKLPISAENSALANIASVYYSSYSSLKNPAIFQQENTVMFSFSNWMLDSRIGLGGFIYRKDDWNLGLALQYLNYGEFTKQTEDASGLYAGSQGTITAYSNLVTIHLSRKPNEGSSIGIGLKFLTLNLGSAASGLVPMMYFGYYQSVTDNLRLGLLMQNLRLSKGVVVYRDVVPISTSFAVGLAYENINLFDIKNFYINLYSEIEVFNDRLPVAKVGTKVDYRRYFLMLGISNQFDYMLPVSLGLGLEYKNTGFSLAFIPSIYDYLWLGSMSFSF